MISVFIAFENKEDSEKVANFLIDKRLAACISLFPVSSFYYWKNEKVVNSAEFEGIIKTSEENFEKIREAMLELLSYEIPQIISVKVENGNEKYLQWLEEQVSFKDAETSRRH